LDVDQQVRDGVSVEILPASPVSPESKRRTSPDVVRMTKIRWNMEPEQELEGASEAEGVGVLAEGLDAEGDVVVEGKVEFGSALDDVFAGDAAGEGFVFHAFFYGTGFEIEDGFGGADKGAGDEEAGEFVAGEEGVFEGSLARRVAIAGMGEDGADDFFGVAVFAEDLGAFGGVLAVGGVVGVGPALVVEVMENGGEAPGIFVGAVFAGIGAHAGFDGEHVFAEGFGLGEFADKFPGVVAGGHWGS
jgi:hypothetical protein